MTGIGDITAKEKREALELALNSRTLHRAEQLKAILRYIVEQDLAGRAGELTEHVIGVDVLGRPPGYSSSEDSSVRTRAYELRQKLEKLYLLEAREAPTQIILPKGSYAPQYARRPGPPPGEDPGGVSVSTAQRTGRPRQFRFPLAWTMLGAAVGALVVWLVVRPAGVQVDPILSEAWGPLAVRDANVILCVATPLHLTVGPASHTRLGSPAYPAPAEAYDEFRQHRPLQPGAKLGLLITDNVLGVGTMNAVVASTNMLRNFGATWQVLPERVAPISSLRNRNAMVFGAPVDSEAITTLLEKTPLTVAYDEGEREFVVLDRASGTKLVPRKDARGEYTEVYGLISVLHQRDSDQHHVGRVVFSGITSTGTQGAAEFFASPRSMRELRLRLPNGRFPAAYQVVVRCTFINRLLLAYEYHSHRLAP
jgi:hypothetical protein